MRKIISAALAVLFVLLCAAPAFATDRSIAYPLQNPTSEQFNAQARAARMALGTALRDFLGSSLSAGGVYTNLTVAPNGGMYVAVAPTTTGTPGAVYQLAQDDPNPLPQGFYTPQLSADTTLTIVPALQSGPSSSIGPLSAPAGGTSQYYLIEAQVQTSDTTPLPMTFLNSQGTPSTLTVNTVRHDGAVFQAKAGTPASSSPAVPSVDSGWVAVAKILIPGGASSITSGMITAYPAFQGFVVNGSSVSVSALTISSLATAGCLQNSNTGVITSSPCTSGLGTVNATSPITSTTSGGVATVACPNCVSGVSATSPISASISSNLLSVSLGTVPIANGGTGQTTLPTGVLQYTGSAITAATGIVTGLTAGTGIAVGTGSTPSVGLSHGDYADLASTQTIGGNKSFTNGIGTQGDTPASGVDLNCGVSGYACKLQSSQGFQMNSTVCSGSINVLKNNGTNEALFDCSGNETLNGSTGLTEGSSTYGPTAMTQVGSGSGSPAVVIGTGTENMWALKIEQNAGSGGSDFTDIGTASGATVQGVTGTALYIDRDDSSNLFTMDRSGDAGFLLNVYATNFFTGSRREWKKNIHPYSFDPLNLLDHVDYAQYECKDPRCGPTGLFKVGIIANDSPWQIAGKKHNHEDAFAMAAIDGKAITELHAKVRALHEQVGDFASASTNEIEAMRRELHELSGVVLVLMVWCGLLTFVVLRRA